MKAAAPMVEAKNISLYIGKTQVLHDISCELPTGRITSFIGRSGTGKTSLLRCMAYLNQGYTGVITCDGESIASLLPQQRALTVGFVFQYFHLFPHMTVWKNCMHPLLTVLKLSKEEASERAFQMLKQLGIDHLKDSYPARLSGGQQQRVAIARALGLRPKVLLFDEPSSALDPESTQGLMQIIRELSSQGVTIAISSHDMAFVRGILDRVYFLEGGKVAEVFDAQQQELSQTKHVRGFLS